MRNHRQRRTLTTIVTGSVVLIMACGGDDGASDASDEVDAPEVTSSAPEGPTVPGPTDAAAETSVVPGTDVPSSPSNPSSQGSVEATSDGSSAPPGGSAVAACDLVTADELAQITGATVTSAAPFDLAGSQSCQVTFAELADPIVAIGSQALEPEQFDAAVDAATSQLEGATVEPLDVGDEGFIATGTVGGAPGAAAGFIAAGQFVTVNVIQLEADPATVTGYAQAMIEAAAAKVG